MAKICTVCDTLKPLMDYHKRKQTKDGRVSRCKECTSEYNLGRYDQVSDKTKATSVQWKKENPHKRLAHRAKYRAAQLNATPSWFEQRSIEAIYAMSKFLSMTTFGSGYHVDHIVPLQGNKVCGLHTANNLQILRASDNLKKSNKFVVS